MDDNGKNPGVKEVVAVGRATGTGSKACRKIAGEIRERTRPWRKPSEMRGVSGGSTAQA